MSFKNFLEEVTYKYKKAKGKANLLEYKQYCSKSTMPKHDVKEVNAVFHTGKGEIPVLHENTFYMVNIKNGATRPVKSRHDKIACGVILNGMLLETGNEELKNLDLPWDVPVEVFKENR